LCHALHLELDPSVEVVSVIHLRGHAGRWAFRCSRARLGLDSRPIICAE
jgi:hypothetical protein